VSGGVAGGPLAAQGPATVGFMLLLVYQQVLPNFLYELKYNVG